VFQYDLKACACLQAVEADSIDILAVQAPDCKVLPASIQDLLHTARTSVLVYRQQTAGIGVFPSEPTAVEVAAN
jgi:hypothetical protein